MAVLILKIVLIQNVHTDVLYVIHLYFAHSVIMDTFFFSFNV